MYIYSTPKPVCTGPGLRLLILVCLLQPALSVFATSDTATVSVDIVSTISITAQSGLLYGDISSGAAAGTVQINTSGTRTTTGGVTVNTAVAGSPASFDVQGDASASYSISLPVSVLLSDTASNSMMVDNFSSSPASAGLLDTSGQQSLFVGATLNVGSNQPYGAYAGLMSVTVDYN